MIAARAPQPSLIYYVTQAGLHRFLTLTAQHRGPPFTDNPSDPPPTMHPLAVLRHTAYGGRGGRTPPRFKLKLCSEQLDLSALTFPDWRWMRACFPDLSTSLDPSKAAIVFRHHREEIQLIKKRWRGVFPFLSHNSLLDMDASNYYFGDVIVTSVSCPLGFPA